MILIKLTHFTLISVLSSTPFHILIHIQHKYTSQSLLVGAVYIPPGSTLDSIIEELEENIEQALDLHPTCDVIIGGDFNARIGQLGEIPDDIVTHLTTNRTSRDKMHTARGRLLIESMTKHNLFALNGRVDGDEEGEYTFINHKGKSTIDLLFCNPTLMTRTENLEIRPSTLSLHSTVTVTISTEHLTATNLNADKTKFRLKPELIQKFKDELTQKINTTEPNEKKNFQLFLQHVITAAIETGNAKITQNGQMKPSKPWYKEECKLAHKNYRTKRNKARKAKWGNLLATTEFIHAKRTYKNICRQQRSIHWNELRSNITKAYNPQTFWNALKPFRPRTRNSNIIDSNAWTQFYRPLMPKRESAIYNTLQGVLYPDMDKPIRLDEVNEAIEKLAYRKAPGPDGIPNELFKALPDTAIFTLRTCLKAIFETETLPAEWSESETVMLHKKGNKNEPANYRPIALLNTGLKLFTQILTNRVSHWVEENKILPEAQAGFRKQRGCEDHIFSLMTAIHTGTQDTKKVYACFIDFKSAFPSVPHNKLWLKLFNLGISSKIIRVLAKLYEKANTKIRLNEGHTPAIDITIGLMQGETLSPLLFSLYIADIEEELKKLNVTGIRISDQLEIHILLYADDMVLLSPTEQGLKMKLRRLEAYFDRLDLVVNLEKTNVMVFRRGGRIPNNPKFKYKGQPIAIVNQYTYLGVPFSSSGLFNKAASHFKNKGIRACNEVLRLAFTSHMESMEKAKLLFNAIARSTVLYCSHLWGLFFLDEIEKVQNHFLRRTLGLGKSGPMYLARMECGVTKMYTQVLKQAIRFRIKILSMVDDRYPLQCYKALIQRTNDSPLYNWVRKLNSITNFEDKELWDSEQISEIAPCIPGWIDLLHLRSFTEDTARATISPTYFPYLEFNPQILQPATYFKLTLTKHYQRILAQSRLGQRNFYVNKSNITLIPQQICNICSLNEKATLHHYMMTCPLNQEIRQILHISNQIQQSSPAVYLNPQTKEDTTLICHLATQSLLNLQEITFSDEN